MSKVDPKYNAQFKALTEKVFVAQAKWFLNGFWDELNGEAEFVWKCVNLCVEISKHKGKVGELDEFEAHRFLEQLGETLSVAAMREKLRDIDVDFNKMMALSEYLIFKYQKTVKEIVSSPQGGNKEEMAMAQELVSVASAAIEELTRQMAAQTAAAAAAKEAANDAFDAAEAAKSKEAAALIAQGIARAKAQESAVAADNATRRAEEAKEAEHNANAKDTESRAASTVAKQAEDASTAAANEQRVALAELKAIEDALASKIAELEAKSQEGPVVARGRAKAELEQLKAGDSMPLRRAKINQEAAVRRFQKAEQRLVEEAKKAAAAAAIASASAKLASETRKMSEQAAASAIVAASEAAMAEQQANQAAHSSSMAAAASRAAAVTAAASLAESEAAAARTAVALTDANSKFEEAVTYLEVVKQKPGQSYGDIWWMERELKEKQRYLPQSQQRKF